MGADYDINVSELCWVSYEVICKCENLYIYIYVIIIVVEVVFTVKNYRERNIIEMLSVVSKGWNELVNP